MLLDSGRAADALRHAHLALAHLSTEEEREAMYMRVGDMYAQLGLSSVAKLFFARALEFQPDSAAAMQAHASVETSKPSSDDESNLHRLALQFFRTGQLDMGLRADVERIALGYERDAGADRALVRDALDQTALLLLTSGLGAHTISMARNLLSSDSVSLACADCQSPKRQMHGDAVLGYTAGDIQRFIDCCLHRRQVLPRLLATRNVTINRANVYGYTPLHLAAAADQSELVNALWATARTRPRRRTPRRRRRCTSRYRATPPPPYAPWSLTRAPRRRSSRRRSISRGWGRRRWSWHATWGSSRGGPDRSRPRVRRRGGPHLPDDGQLEDVRRRRPVRAT